MSTIAPTPPMVLPAEPPSSAPSLLSSGDKRTLFRGVPWETYRSLSEATGEGEHVRLAYDGKDLEIRTVGNIHEFIKEFAGIVVDAVATGLDVDFVACGETTWDAPPRGLQADLPTTSTPGRSTPGKRRCAARRTLPTIPIPTWPSKSTCPLLRTTGPQFTGNSVLPRSGALSGSNGSSSSNSRLTRPMPRSRKAASCEFAPMMSCAGERRVRRTGPNGSVA